MSGAQSGAAEDDLPYSKAAYVEEPAFPDYRSLHAKSPAAQKVRDLFYRKGWPCTNWYLALFYMFSEEDIAQCLRFPDAARYYGSVAELFGTLRTYLIFTCTSHLI